MHTLQQYSGCMNQFAEPAVQPRGQPDVDVSPEAVVRRLIDLVFCQGRLELVDELIAEDIAEHQNGHVPGPQGVKAVVASLHKAFSDFRLTIEDLVVAQDIVWTRNVATGTNDGSYMGHAATYRPICVDVFDVMRVANGKIVEHWGVPDRLLVLAQLGLLQQH